MLKGIITTIGALGLLFSYATSADTINPHSMHMPKKTLGSKDSVSTKSYKAGMDKMHEEMMIEYSGDADIDFVRGMIPHHQGAVDMAQTVLEYGKDPQLKKLALEIIKAQKDEIKFMQDWLNKHDKPKIATH